MIDAALLLIASALAAGAASSSAIFIVRGLGVGLTPTYGFYAADAFIALFFVRALARETRGRELEDMVG
jgi:SP family sugar:H+ symporter-like MFS transporter